MSRLDDLDPLELFKSELREEDHEQIISSISRVRLIGLALGPERVKRDLVPFLKDFVEQGDNDEANAAVAAQLGDFVDLVGGPNEAHILLPFLDQMCSLEEPVIRNAVTDSLRKVIVVLPKKDVLTKVFPMIKRLATGEWFTTRVSVSALFAATYPNVPEDAQTELRSIYNNLCNDDTPMVRKSAYINLGEFALQVQKDYVKSDIIPMIKALSTDELDSMRIFTIDCCSCVSQMLDPAEFQSLVLPLVEAVHDDGSWRVRQQLCRHLDVLCKHAGDSLASDKLLPLFAKLLQDPDVQVRTAATKMLDRVGQHARSGLLTHIVPCFEALATDSNEKVKVAFSAAIIPLCASFGSDATQKLLLPICQSLAKDELADVRNNIISKVDVLGQVIGNDAAVDTILPTLLDLAKDVKWRVRMEVVGKTSSLARQMGLDIFEKKLLPIVISGLGDHVFSIREKACEQVCELVGNFGVEWAIERLFPSALAVFFKSTNYLHRMTSLLIVANVVDKMKPAQIENHLLPLVLTACKDDVANVRFASAKTLAKLIPRVEKSVYESQIKAILQGMVKDDDVDVQYFAEEALKAQPS